MIFLFIATKIDKVFKKIANKIDKGLKKIFSLNIIIKILSNILMLLSFHNINPIKSVNFIKIQINLNLFSFCIFFIYKFKNIVPGDCPPLIKGNIAFLYPR